MSDDPIMERSPPSRPTAFSGWLPFEMVENRWPPRDVKDAFRLAGCSRAADLWAGPYGNDYERAWHECSEGTWLFKFARLLFERAPEEERLHSLRGFGLLLIPPSERMKKVPTKFVLPEHQDVERVRRLIDGVRLIRACGLSSREGVLG